MMLRFAIAVALFVYGVLWILRHVHLPDVLLEMAGWLVLWLGIMGFASRAAWQRLGGPFTRKPVLIVDKRLTEVMRFLIVEDESGVRTEHVVSARVFESATVGAIGVLFTKRDVAWGFHPVG